MEIEVEITKKQDEKEKEFDEYECRRFAETLMDAENIKKDPKKLAAAKKHLEGAVSAISSISDLKKIRQKKAMESDY